MRLLIVGNQSSQIATASKIARDNGADVSHVPDVNSALEFARSSNGADLIMIDVSLDVANLINSLLSERINVPVVGCGLNNDSKAAVAAIKAGAKEYIPLPPDAKLIAAVLEAITRDSNNFICDSRVMRKVMTLCDQVAPSEASILITGESGTGKEVIAKYIHKKSRRAKGRMVSVNCAAIPDNLLESELFGHEKGAFTGAIAKRIGKFEEANNSTLLLDEISEMDIRLQAKLLRAIQEKEIDRVGGSQPVKINIRIIATSNRDLREEVKKGNFREDLYFRLNVIHFELPKLKEREEDIDRFAEYFVKRFCEENGFSVKMLSKDALQKLKNYSWPGNVREMENAIHRAVLVSPEMQINANDIMITGEPDNDNGVTGGAADGLVGRTIGAVEKDLIINTLDHCLGNRTHAANILGISIRTLRNKLNEYGVAAGN
jgi:two-component system response regulator FlrC